MKIYILNFLFYVELEMEAKRIKINLFYPIEFLKTRELINFILIIASQCLYLHNTHKNIC